MGGRDSERDDDFTAFVAARQAHLRRVALAVSRDPDRAEDVLQIALTKLYLAWPRVRRDGGEEAYVRRIIVRADLDELRRPWRRRERPDLDGLEVPADEGLSSEDRDSLHDALRRLPPLQRRAVLLRHWLGLSVAETAADLGVGQGTVKSSTSRGLAALRRHLEQADTERSPAEDAADRPRRPPGGAVVPTGPAWA